MEDTLQAINKPHQKLNTDYMHEDINTKKSNTRHEHNILRDHSLSEGGRDGIGDG